MLRSILEVSSRRAIKRFPRQITSQIPICVRKELSTTPNRNATPQPASSGKPPASGGSMSKIALGGAAIGAAILVAYQTGYLDQIASDKGQHDPLKEAKIGDVSRDGKSTQNFGEQSDFPRSEETNKLTHHAEPAEKVETPSDIPHAEVLSERQVESPSQIQDNSVTAPEEGIIPAKEKDLPYNSHHNVASDNQSLNLEVSTQESLHSSGERSPSTDSEEKVQTPLLTTQATATEENSEIKIDPPPQIISKDRGEDTLRKDLEPPSSLLEAYDLGDEMDRSSLNKQENNHLSEEKESFLNAIEGINDGYLSKDGKLVLDFLEAIHTAEKRQAELDARIYADEKRAMKEKYEKDLKDAGVRELMLAEEAAMLDKELKRERVKAAAALKALQEKLEEKFKRELEQKENDAELKLKQVQELAKAELAVRIVSEKASQIEKMTEANLNINALCMAFYARSEEARRSHSAHKLALGALAMEDALSKGLPIRSEIEALQNYLEGIGKDSGLDLVLSSLPDETRNNGTDTLLHLNQKFDALKDIIRHFSLIPPGGGGILAHSLAHLASWLKVKEVEQYGDGIESVINKVECYLAEGKIVEAADVLEEGVRGTQATEIVGDWLRCARNRAITEQALTLLQSYATAISLT